MGERGQDRRGWSVVFDDRTDEAVDDTSKTMLPERTVATASDFEGLDPAEATDAHPMPSLESSSDYDAADPPTIIDEALAADVQAAIASASASSGLSDTDEAIDERLANVALALESTDESLSAPIEQTVRTRSPFEVSVSPVIETEPITDQAEKTQRARVPYDLRIEHTLPPTARDNREKPPVVIERVAKGVVPVEPEPPRPEEANAAERTALDLAAALGMAPQPSTSKPPEPKSSTPPPPELRVPEKSPERKLDFGLDAPNPPAPKAKRPHEGARSDQLQGVAESTQRLAKLLPIALGILLVFATIAVSLQLFDRTERQEHIELRFMGIGSTTTVTTPSETGTPIVIDTEPPGLLVLFDRQVLGKTPYTGTVPVRLEEQVAVELSSPYFERWLGEVRATPSGTFKINVQLARKPRR